MIELFYAPGARPGAERVALDGAEARHVCRVLRHRVGDRLRATDGLGTEFELELEKVGPDRVEGRVVATRREAREPKRRVALAQALLKGDRLAEVVEAATEVGVSEFIPLVTERVVARVGPERLRRLEQVAVSGMKTSARTRLPRIGPLTDVDGLVALAGEYGQVLVAHELEERPGMAGVLDRAVQSVLLVVGPEGGLTGPEVERLRATGARSFTLGPRRLRAETAALVVSSLCLHLLGDME